MIDKSKGRDTLLCPNCGFDYTHEISMDCWFRFSEESNDCNHTHVDSENAFVDGDISGNPSDRRNGFTMVYYCENCNAISQLEIAQHKGMIFLDTSVVKNGYKFWEYHEDYARLLNYALDSLPLTDRQKEFVESLLDIYTRARFLTHKQQKSLYSLLISAEEKVASNE